MINHDGLNHEFNGLFKKWMKNGLQEIFKCSLYSYVKLDLLHYDTTVLYLDFFKFKSARNLLITLYITCIFEGQLHYYRFSITEE